MAHRTDYRFYIQLYPQGSTTYPKEDIEQKFGCDYMKFTNLIHDGEVKNTYSEEWAEQSGVRIYIPKKSELAYKSYECKLKLFFHKGDVQSRMKTFTDYIMGEKIEWSDNFRNVYATLLCTKTPNIEQERLYGDDPFIVVEYTFTNILGRTFSESQIN